MGSAYNRVIETRKELTKQLLAEMEQDNKELLISFEGKYPGATTSENVERIITDFKKKQKRNQTLNWLKNQKQENAQDIEADDELDK